LDTQTPNGTLGEKLHNELYVLGNGISQSVAGIEHAAEKALHDPATIVKVTASAVMGLGLGALAGRTGALGLIGRSLGIAATTSMVFDGVKPFYSAATTAWNATSRSQLDRASATLGQSIGDFTVDFAIQTPGAMLGGGLARTFESGKGAGLWRQHGMPERLQGFKSGLFKPAEEPMVTGIDFKGALLQPVRSEGEALSSEVISHPNSLVAETQLSTANAVKAETSVSTPQPVKQTQLSRIDAVQAERPRTNNGTAIHGFDFAEIKSTDTEIPAFDMGVGIDDSALLHGRRNLVSPRKFGDRESLALGALYCPTARLPRVGKTLAITERSTDSLTALAILANRAESRKVNQNIVKLVAEHGIGSVEPQAIKGYKAISLVAEQDGMKIGDRVRFIRAVLDNTVTPQDLNVYSERYDAMQRKHIPGDILAKRSVGLRSFNDQLIYSYHQAGTNQPSFDYAIGTDDRNIVGDASIIDQNGSSNIVQTVMAMSDDELPKPGSSMVFAETDINRLTAAAILENRVEGNPMRKSLIDYILRRGSQSERIPADERENVMAAYDAMEGFSNDPHIRPDKKIAAIKNLLSNDVPARNLLSMIYEFALFRPSNQPFKYVRTTAYKPKPFDFGVEITTHGLVRGQPNLLHPQAGMLSAAEQALKLDESQLPARDARVAIEKPDADALTAIAVMANRLDGIPVNARLVEAVGRRDRGLDSDPEGKPYEDIEAPFLAIRSFARNKNILITQRIAAIRVLLAGAMRETELTGLVDRFKGGQAEMQERAESDSKVTEHISGKMVYVETPMNNWYASRALGLKHAPVAVIAATEGNRTHFQVLARSEDPIASQLGNALKELQQLEHGWGGHEYIFVSSGNSKLSAQTVLDIVGKHAFGTSR
jgi:hypothetical protein